MRSDLFRSMQEQMNPSPEAREELEEKLAGAPRRRPAWLKYAAAAACAAVAVLGAAAAVQFFRTSSQQPAPSLHSYVYAAETPAGTLETALGTPEAEESGEVQTPSAGEDNPVQPAQAVLTRLMESFSDGEGGDPRYPEWYGGSYLDSTGCTVVVVEDRDTPELREEILSTAAESEEERAMISFQSGAFSLAYLNELMERIQESGAIMDVLSTLSVNEMENRLDLMLTEADEEALKELGSLDPDDSAVLVSVGEQPDTLDTFPAGSGGEGTPAFPGTFSSDEGVPEEDDADGAQAGQTTSSMQTFSGTSSVSAAPAGAAVFQGKVLESRDSTLLVEVTGSSGGLQPGDQVTFSWEGAADIAAGTSVEVEFGGGIMETWPAQLGDVQRVTVLE